MASLKEIRREVARREAALEAAKSELDRAEMRENADRNLLHSFPEPRHDRATVTFCKWYNGSTEYFYAAVKSPKGWSVTGRTTMNGITWKALLHFIIKDEENPIRAMESLRWVQKSIPASRRRSTIVRREAEIAEAEEKAREAEAAVTKNYVERNASGTFGYADIISEYDTRY